MSKQGLAWTKVNEFINKKAGIFLKDLPDRVCMEDWVEDDMTEKEIDDSCRNVLTAIESVYGVSFHESIWVELPAKEFPLSE